MRKVLCLLLAGVICMGLFGCGISKRFTVLPSEKKAMLEHLEEKYGEKFVIESTSTPGWNENSVTRGAYVYPEGKEYDRFFVEITRKGVFIDQYALRLMEARMLPVYEEWIHSIIPSAKVSLELDISAGDIEDMMYNPNETLQQFVSETGRLGLIVNIMLSETTLESRDDIFNKLSNAPITEPITGYHSNAYRIGFFVQNVFDSIESGKYKRFTTIMNSEEEYLIEGAKDIVAATFCNTKLFGKPTETQHEILSQLNENFEIKDVK